LHEGRKRRQLFRTGVTKTWQKKINGWPRVSSVSKVNIERWKNINNYPLSFWDNLRDA